MNIWFDRQGNPVSVEQWTALREDPEYHRVAEAVIGPVWISTVWLGIDHGFGATGLPVIFETMIFPADEGYWDFKNRDRQASIMRALHPELRELIEQQWRYSTEAQAIAGHDAVCVDVRVLLANIEMADYVMQEAIDRVKETP